VHEGQWTEIVERERDMMATGTISGLGWQRDLPDTHDYSVQHPDVTSILRSLPRLQQLPELVDWRDFCGPPDDQGGFNSSPAHACAGLLQFHQRRASGRLIEPSRLFIYRNTQRMIGSTGDNGAGLRSTLKAIVQFGVASEKVWPFRFENLHAEPDAFAYAAANPYQSMKYVRLDQSGNTGEQNLAIVKAFLAAGFACVFGFPVYNSIEQAADIAFPTQANQMIGGQAVVAVGYADGRRYRSDKGAILIKSSWGQSWGDGGFGWLPYEYVRRQLAADFWIVLRPEWLSSGDFYLPDIDAV